METSVAQKTSTDEIVDRVVQAAWLVMAGAMKVGGLRIAPSIRAGGAAAKYINQSKDTYRGNPIVEGAVDSIQRRKDERYENVDLNKLDPAEVVKGVEEINTVLEAEGERGIQAKNFVYGVAEAMVNASGSGFMGSGKRVTEDEAKFLADLKAHLRI